eukprot:gene8956-biopygen934
MFGSPIGLRRGKCAGDGQANLRVSANALHRRQYDAARGGAEACDWSDPCKGEAAGKRPGAQGAQANARATPAPRLTLSPGGTRSGRHARAAPEPPGCSGWRMSSRSAHVSRSSYAQTLLRKLRRRIVWPREGLALNAGGFPESAGPRSSDCCARAETDLLLTIKDAGGSQHDPDCDDFVIGGRGYR